MMEYRDGMFQLLLAEYAMFEVRKAFIEFVKSDSGLPTPSDIIKLIENDRLYRVVNKPDIQKLRSMKAKGIPLTPKQEAMINEQATVD